MKYQVLRLLAVMLALAVMAAACGSDSNPDAVATAADATLEEVVVIGLSLIHI